MKNLDYGHIEIRFKNFTQFTKKKKNELFCYRKNKIKEDGVTSITSIETQGLDSLANNNNSDWPCGNKGPRRRLSSPSAVKCRCPEGSFDAAAVLSSPRQLRGGQARDLPRALASFSRGSEPTLQSLGARAAHRPLPLSRLALKIIKAL